MPGASASAVGGTAVAASPSRSTAALSTVGVSRRIVIPRWMVLVLAVAAQAAFGQVMLAVPLAGLVPAATVGALVVYAAATRNTALSLCLVAYIPAMEIAVRQSRAPVPYMYGPYLLITIAVLAVFTNYNRMTKPGRTALLYLLLLVPSAIATISVAGSEARELIVFALAGPTAMTLLIVLMSQIRLQAWLHQRLMWVFLISGVAPITIAMSVIDDYLAAGESLDFRSESNFITSGGFGPVQVSSIMGLSVFIAVVTYVRERDPAARLVALAIGLVAVVMSLLTFSRGGMSAAVLAVMAFAIAQATNPRERRRVIAISAVIVVIGMLVIVPRLNSFTDGAFEERFTDTSSTRTDLANDDIEIFRENVLFGVGPGLTRYHRLTWEVCQLRQDLCANEGSSHTEFTRMLGEHGIPGLAALLVMALLPIQAVRRAGPSRALTIGFLAWAIAQMFYANFRVSAVAVVFAFAFLQVENGPPRARLDSET